MAFHHPCGSRESSILRPIQAAHVTKVLIAYLFAPTGIPRTMLRLRNFFLLALLALTSTTGFAFDYPLAKPQTADNSGRPAPDFTVKDQDGHDFTLSSLRGKKVLLVFYRAHWCPYCMSMIRDLAENRKKFDAAGVKIVAISLDTLEFTKKVHESAAQRQFPVLSDAEGRVVRTYGLLDAVSSKKAEIAIRTLVFIDEQGIEQWRRISQSAADVIKSEDILKRLHGE
jgi:peroxiredoxin